MFRVTGALLLAAVVADPLELLLPQAASESAPTPSAPARRASRRVIMLSVIRLSSSIYFRVVKYHRSVGLPAELHQRVLSYRLSQVCGHVRDDRVICGRALHA